MAFKPSAAQLNKLRKAVRSYNSAVSRLAKSGRFDVVPYKTSMAREREFVSSAQDLNLRVKQLRRILTTEKADAQKAVEFHGEVMPAYMRDEIRNIVKSTNERRKAIRSELFPDFDEMTRPQQAAALSNRNLMDLEESDYVTQGGFESLLDEEYPNIPKKAEVYISVWEDFGGSSEVSQMIREMAEQDPEGFERLMESPDIEKEIEYVYGEVGAGSGAGYVGKSGYTYKRQSGFRGNQINRYKNAREYWEEQYMDFKNREGYFHD